MFTFRNTRPNEIVSLFLVLLFILSLIFVIEFIFEMSFLWKSRNFIYFSFVLLQSDTSIFITSFRFSVTKEILQSVPLKRMTQPESFIVLFFFVSDSFFLFIRWQCASADYIFNNRDNARCRIKYADKKWIIQLYHEIFKRLWEETKTFRFLTDLVSAHVCRGWLRQGRMPPGHIGLPNWGERG